MSRLKIAVGGAIILAIFIFAACTTSGDNNNNGTTSPGDSGSYFIYDGTTYTLASAIIEDYGAIGESEYDLDFTAATSEVDLTIRSDTGSAVYLDLTSPNSTLAPGTYIWSITRTDYTLLDARIALNYNFGGDTGTMIDAIGGTVTVFVNGNTYTVEFTLSMVDGKPVTGSYSGPALVMVPAVPATGVSLNKSDITIATGNTEQLTATIVPRRATNQNVTWSSSDETKATVSTSGLVTAVAVGSATITVTTEDGGFTATCTVTVSAVPVAVTDVSLNKSDTTIATGNTEQLTATIAPADATNQNVTWSSSDETKATVSTSGLVTTVAVGSTTITVTTEDGGFTATCTVIILTPGDKVTFTVDSVSFDMAYIPGKSFKTGTDDSGTATVGNPYWIGETEVTYELWYAVRDWAENTASPAYTFANDGREGNDGTIGAAPTNQEPVTTINWRDAMVWSNAATEWYNAKNGTSYSCAYYTDAAYSTPIRSVDGTGSVTYPDPGGQDDPYVNPDATGFRMLTSGEWELAARYIDDANGNGDIEDIGEFYPGNYASGADAQWDATTGGSDIDGDSDIEYSTDVAVFKVGSTAIVKSKSPNKMGLYDISGNVWEWCFNWYAWYGSGSRVFRGGGYVHPSAGFIRLGFVGGGDPYNNLLYDMGFRLARAQ